MIATKINLTEEDAQKLTENCKKSHVILSKKGTFDQKMCQRYKTL